MSVSLDKTIRYLDQGKSFSIRNGRLEKDSFFTRVLRLVNKSFDSLLKYSVLSYSKQQLDDSAANSEHAGRLADLCIRRYDGDKYLAKRITTLDRHLTLTHPERAFLSKTNQSLCKKWERYGFDRKIFVQYPEFASYLLVDTPLGSQMKVTRDTPEMGVNKTTGEREPGIKVEGSWMPFSDLKTRFQAVSAPRYGETFMAAAADTSRSIQVFTYLDNGDGLQPFHPYLDLMPKPISRLDDADYQRTLDVAHSFVREGEENLSDVERARLNKDRSFVFQIVSSRADVFDFNANNLLRRSKHPWIRVLVGEDNPELGTKKGDVYETGFGWKERVTLPFSTVQGAMRGMDMWNFKQCEERVVTNVAISQDEAVNLFKKASQYHSRDIALGHGISFNLAHQNCSVFVRWAGKLVGVNAPSEISAAAALVRMAPDWMKSIGRGVLRARYKTISLIDRVTPFVPKWIKAGSLSLAGRVELLGLEIAGLFGSLSLAIGRLIGGGAFGKHGRAFGSGEEIMGPPSRRWWKAFHWRDYKVNLPAVLQEWQREQASTVYYPNPTRLSIVPPQAS